MDKKNGKYEFLSGKKGVSFVMLFLSINKKSALCKHKNRRGNNKEGCPALDTWAQSGVKAN
ncbi:hypothetical protein DUD43_08820 [Alcaligenes faecalis]|nr:hypothetical protein DUD43_08820 [Alcaligenes faecalis]